MGQRAPSQRRGTAQCPWATTALAPRWGWGTGHPRSEGGCALAAGAALGCSHGQGAEDAAAAPARPLCQPGEAGAPQPFFPLPAPHHTQRGQNRCREKESPGKKQKKTKIRQGSVGSGREGTRAPEGPTGLCSQHWHGHGAEMCPCFLPKSIQQLTITNVLLLQWQEINTKINI